MRTIQFDNLFQELVVDLGEMQSFFAGFLEKPVLMYSPEVKEMNAYIGQVVGRLESYIEVIEEKEEEING